MMKKATLVCFGLTRIPRTTLTCSPATFRRGVARACLRGRKIRYYIFLVFVLAHFSARSVFASDDLYFLHTDHLGSTRVVTDSGGTTVASYDYYPYGSINNQQLTINKGIERLYTNQIYDQTADLYFYNARYYNPSLGHFISADSVQGANRYLYVFGNPINSVDPSGNIAPIRRISLGDLLSVIFGNQSEGGGGVGGYAESPQTPFGCGGNVGCYAQEVAASFTYGLIGWDPFNALSERERTELEMGMGLLGVAGGVGYKGKLSPDQIDELFSLRSPEGGGWSMRAIARKLGVKTPAVFYHLKKQGDPLGGQRGIDPIVQAQVQDMIESVSELRSQRCPWPEVAEEVGYTRVPLFKFLKTHEFVDPLKGSHSFSKWKREAMPLVYGWLEEGTSVAQIVRRTQLEGLGPSGTGISKVSIFQWKKWFAGWGGPLPPLPE